MLSIWNSKNSSDYCAGKDVIFYFICLLFHFDKHYESYLQKAGLHGTTVIENYQKIILMVVITDQCKT